MTMSPSNMTEHTGFGIDSHFSNYVERGNIWLLLKNCFIDRLETCIV